MQSLAKGVKMKPCKNYLDCHVCKLAKSKEYPKAKERTSQTQRPFQLVHTNITGPFAPSMRGVKYVLIIVDDYTCYSFCYLIKSKAEGFNHFRNWVKFVGK